MNQPIVRLDSETRRALQMLIDLAAPNEIADRRRTSLPGIESPVDNPWSAAADGYDCVAS